MNETMKQRGLRHPELASCQGKITDKAADREELAKKIALLLAESKTKFNEIDYVFMLVKSFLTVSFEDVNYSPWGDKD